jgi:hypothetical protein
MSTRTPFNTTGTHTPFNTTDAISFEEVEVLEEHNHHFMLAIIIFMLPGRKMQIFEALFKGTSTRFWPLTIEKSLNFMLPKRRFRKDEQITPPKRRFVKEEQKITCGFSSTFQGCEYSIWATNCGKVLRKSAFYPSQTKILDGRTNVSECFFEALFNDL